MNKSKKETIYDSPVQCVEYHNGKTTMYAAIVPLAIALRCIQIKPTKTDWLRVGYIRVIYNDNKDRDMLDYYGKPIRELVNDIEAKKDMFQLRISFFIDTHDYKYPSLKKIRSTTDIINFLQKYPPIIVNHPDEKQPTMKIVTIADTPSHPNQIQIVYSGFNKHGDIKDLFNKVYIGYAAYASSLDVFT